ncbi:MAG: 3-dehydroquinate synthase [Spirochaetaceae bacterium]|nr:3-dehydroquinate synthase [Spirochaetaceae bacterium]
MSKKRPVFLVGMMGAGKSTVGPALAARLGRRFFDSDEEIERRAGRSIPAIFEDEGESGFRAREVAAIGSLAEHEDGAVVIALGGGAIVQPGALERLRARGEIVLLEADAAVLARRVGAGSGRPLLAGLSARARAERIEALLAERRPWYEAADHRVDADAGVDEVVDRIVAALRRDSGSGNGARRSMSESGARAPKRAARTGSKGAPASARPSKRSAKGEGRVHARVPVALADRSYAIELGQDWLTTIGRRIGDLLACERIALVTVPTVARRYAPRLSKGLTASGARVGRIVVPDGDATKNPRELARLWDRFLDLGLDRHSAVVTLGGGVVGDLGGFAAATFLRGIPFVQVPTTVLAMVDASIGGKTGINLARGKNLVGAFHQPRGVFIDIDTLRSLPRRERAAGAAELIKAAAIWDAELFAWLESEIEAFLDLEPSVVLHALERGCAIKAEVVARDEREGGLRRLLNFGHTLAHAIETHARYRGILHGEAVSIGMVFAAERSEALGLSPAGTRDRLAALLERAGLPTRAPDRPRRAYLSAIAVDKKKQGGNIHFVVLKGIGNAGTVSLSPREILPPGWKP